MNLRLLSTWHANEVTGICSHFHLKDHGKAPKQEAPSVQEAPFAPKTCSLATCWASSGQNYIHPKTPKAEHLPNRRRSLAPVTLAAPTLGQQDLDACFIPDVPQRDRDLWAKPMAKAHQLPWRIMPATIADSIFLA